MKLAMAFGFACVLALAGCAAQGVWTHPHGSHANFERDKAQCQYESTAATQGVDYGYQTAVGQAFDQAFRRAEVYKLCMKAKGYVWNRGGKRE